MLLARLVLVATNLDQAKSAVISRQHGEIEALVIDRLTLSWQMAELTRYQTTDSVELVVGQANIEVLVEVLNISQCFNDKTVIVERFDVAIIVLSVVLILNFTDDLF